MPGETLFHLIIIIKFFDLSKSDGSFDEPDWDEYNCVYRKFSLLKLIKFSHLYVATTTECWDCTTTSKISQDT